MFEIERICEARQKIKEREYFGKHSSRTFSSEDLGRFTRDICGVLIPRFDNTTSALSNLVMTQATKTNLRNIAKTIVAEKPLLLESVPGAGKSFLIDQVAKLFGKFDGAFYYRPLLTNRHGSNNTNRSNGCKDSTWNLCHYDTWIVYLASRDSYKGGKRGEMDCY